MYINMSVRRPCGYIFYLKTMWEDKRTVAIYPIAQDRCHYLVQRWLTADTIEKNYWKKMAVQHRPPENDFDIAWKKTLEEDIEKRIKEHPEEFKSETDDISSDDSDAE